MFDLTPEPEFVPFEERDNCAYVVADAFGWWAIVRRDGREVQRTRYEGLYEGAVLKDGVLMPLDKPTDDVE